MNATMTRTYGKATLDGGRWSIEAEPHVMMRLKRMFGGLRQEAAGVVQLTDTLDVSRDLEWFCQRYPLEVSPASYLRRRVKEYRERETIVSKLLAGLGEPQAFDLRLPPRDYQRVAAEIVLASGGLLVADELGLGKTIVGICVVADPRARPALIVCPSHLQSQWADEFKKFAPQLETHILKKGTPYDLSKGTGRRPVSSDQLSLAIRAVPDVLITTYNKLPGWADTLAQGIVKSVVYDEVHELRHAPETEAQKGTKKGAAAMRISESVSYRCGLSATPIFNYGGELYNVMQALRPGELGEKYEFLREWARGVDDRGRARIANPQAFGTYLRDSGLMLRRTRAEVGRELPDLIKVPHAVAANENALNDIEKPAIELARIIVGQSELKLEKGEQFSAGGQLDAMVRRATGVAKAPYVAEFVRMLLETDEKVVLYGWHHEVYGIWKQALKDFKPSFYTGTESTKQKDEAKRRFCEGETNLMVVSLRSGAGLDGLQYSGCKTVVFGELDWSPSAMEQCAGRIHRDGMKDPVVAYYMIADVGADPIISDVLGVKRAQLEGIRSPQGGEFLEKLDVGGANVRRLAEAYLKKAKAS